jgi:PKD repeat protein
MIGYLKPGDPVHISLIYPASAAPLANYNNNITDIYFPTIPITSYANLSGGDSDHTSFNQNGIYGIWTFEDWHDCSPQIHTSNDIIGPSVNNPEQCRIFTQINLASIATLAGLVYDTTLPISNFSASERTINEGSTVQFTDLSLKDPTSWLWHFEGGTPLSSIEQNPVITYSTTGKYAVSLKVSNSFGDNTLLRNNYITVTMLPPIADFTANITEIAEGETVSFTNTSQNNPDKYEWYFQGGTPQYSSEENPVISYANEGTYNVFLTVKKGTLTHIERKNDYIKVHKNVWILDPDISSTVIIYPNPAEKELQVYKVQTTGQNPLANIEIFDVLGRNVYSSIRPSVHSFTIDISHLQAGVYFLHVDGEVFRIMKN